MENQSNTNEMIRSFHLTVDEINMIMSDALDSDAKMADFWYGRVEDVNNKTGQTVTMLPTPYSTFKNVYGSITEIGRLFDAGYTLFPECLGLMHKP